MAEQDEQTRGPVTGHALLARFGGAWSVECLYYMDPAMPPMQAVGEETVEQLGEYWTVGSFKTQMMGVPFVGRCLLGYEPDYDRWVCTRISSVSPYMYVSTGNFDESGKILTLRGKGPHPQTGSVTAFRTTDELLGNGDRKFEMFVELPDGGEQKLSTYIYRR